MWTNLTSQEHIKDKLISLFVSRKISHAYLFYGSEGIGKDAAAIELAKLLNCENVQNGCDACDECYSCKSISAFKSEYLNFICALPTSKSESNGDPLESLSTSDFDEYLAELHKKAENPYHKINLANANNIRINSIRWLNSKIYLTGNEKKKKVFLISEADRMRQEAANSLLKILEEPPKNSIIILTTSKLNSLPPTITGRCQRLHFHPLTNDEVKEKILSLKKKDKEELSEFGDKEIQLACQLCGGSITKAIELLNYGADEVRKEAVLFLLSILKNDPAEVVAIARNMSGKSKKDKPKFFLFLLNTWFRDLLQNKFNVKKNSLIANQDLLDRLSSFNKNFPNTNIYDIILQLEEAEKMLGQNINPETLLIDLSFKLKRMIR